MTMKNFNESLAARRRCDSQLAGGDETVGPAQERITTNLDASLDKLNRGLTDVNDLVARHRPERWHLQAHSDRPGVVQPVERSVMYVEQEYAACGPDLEGSGDVRG